MTTIAEVVAVQKQDDRYSSTAVVSLVNREKYYDKRAFEIEIPAHLTPNYPVGRLVRITATPIR